MTKPDPTLEALRKRVDTTTTELDAALAAQPTPGEPPRRAAARAKRVADATAALREAAAKLALYVGTADILVLPEEPEFASPELVDAVLARYFTRRAETDNDDPTGPVYKGTAAARYRASQPGWLRNELEREVTALERAWRTIAIDAAEQLTAIHAGSLGTLSGGMTQTDQARRQAERLPVTIATTLDVATHMAIMAERLCPDCKGSEVMGGPGSYYDPALGGSGKPCPTCEPKEGTTDA